MQRHGYRDWDKIFAFCRPYILSHKKEFKVLFATIFLGTFISNLIPLIWGKLIDSLSNINIGKLLLFCYSMQWSLFCSSLWEFLNPSLEQSLIIK